MTDKMTVYRLAAVNGLSILFENGDYMISNKSALILLVFYQIIKIGANLFLKHLFRSLASIIQLFRNEIM